MLSLVVGCAPTHPAVSEPRTVTAAQMHFIDLPHFNYPVGARRAGETGRALVRILIDATGRPANVSLLRSSGNPALDEEALSSMRKARFKPYVEDGVAQPVWIVFPVQFILTGQMPPAYRS